MTFHPEVLWAQRSSETDETKVSDPTRICVERVAHQVASQNVLYVTVNLPDIKPDTLQYDLTPTKLSFKAKAGK